MDNFALTTSIGNNTEVVNEDTNTNITNDNYLINQNLNNFSANTIINKKRKVLNNVESLKRTISIADVIVNNNYTNNSEDIFKHLKNKGFRKSNSIDMKSTSYKNNNAEEIEFEDQTQNQGLSSLPKIYPNNNSQVTATININANASVINPMANHSTKNAYPTLSEKIQTTNTQIENMLAMPHSDTFDQIIDQNKVNKQHKNTHNTPIEVESRVVILKVGQIDTRNERYDAEAYIECSWHDDSILRTLADSNLFNNNGNNNQHAHIPFMSNIRRVSVQSNSPPLSSIQQSQSQTNSVQQNNLNSLNILKSIMQNINNFEYDSNLHWSPQLYIENAIGDVKEEVRHKLEIVEKANINKEKNGNTNVMKYMSNLTVRVCEMRKLRGVFYERLELYDFPMDIQELSITLTSKRSNHEVLIVENTENPCSINTEDFLDQQEWDLFSHVKTSTKLINDQWRKYDRSCFSVTAFIARKPGYYIYNAYMLIFLITILGFVPFAFDPAAPQFRAQVTGLLLLTSVNFRWIVTQRLPSVPYLTSLDKYAIGSLLFLVFFCVWHSLIGSSIITTTNKKNIDTYILYGLAALYFIYNLFYCLWFLKMSRTIRNFKDQCQLKASLSTSPPPTTNKQEVNPLETHENKQANNLSNIAAFKPRNAQAVNGNLKGNQSINPTNRQNSNRVGLGVPDSSLLMYSP